VYRLLVKVFFVLWSIPVCVRFPIFFYTTWPISFFPNKKLLRHLRVVTLYPIALWSCNIFLFHPIIHPGRWTAGTYSHHSFFLKEHDLPNLHDSVPCWSSGLFIWSCVAFSTQKSARSVKCLKPHRGGETTYLSAAEGTSLRFQAYESQPILPEIKAGSRPCGEEIF